MALKDIRLELLEMRRRFDRLNLTVIDGTPPPEVIEIARTEAHADARPRVSVITALYNYERHIGRGAAVGGRQHVRLHRAGRSSTTARATARATRRAAWMAAHEDVPRPARRPSGQPRPRRRAQHGAGSSARGELIFVLDADNVLYPRCIERLVAALDADPGATFSYGMLEMFDEQGPVSLRSPYPWQPERLRDGNFIDAMALIRARGCASTAATAPTRGCTAGRTTTCGAASRRTGGRGAFVPTVVARYRTTSHSMLTITDISTRVADSVLAERHPRRVRGRLSGAGQPPRAARASRYSSATL